MQHTGFGGGFQAGRAAHVALLLPALGGAILATVVRQQGGEQRANVPHLDDAIPVDIERSPAWKLAGHAVLVAGRLAGFSVRLLQTRDRGSSQEQQPGRAEEEGPGTLDRLRPSRGVGRFPGWSAAALAPTVAPTSAGTVQEAGTPSSSFAKHGSSDTTEHQGGSLGSCALLVRRARYRRPLTSAAFLVGDGDEVAVRSLHDSRGWSSGEFTGFSQVSRRWIAFIPVPLASPFILLFKNDNIKETVGSLRELVWNGFEGWFEDGRKYEDEVLLIGEGSLAILRIISSFSFEPENDTLVGKF